jgi:hypothetical protein
MSCADKSQSGRVRRLKGKANAAFYLENHIQPRDAATFLSIQEGARHVLSFNRYDVDEDKTDYGCCPLAGALAGPPTNIVIVQDNSGIRITWDHPVDLGNYPIIYYALVLEPGEIIASGLSPLHLTNLTPGNYVLVAMTENGYAEPAHFTYTPTTTTTTRATTTTTTTG